MHFGIDSMRPGPEGKVNSLVHKACLELDITHIEPVQSGSAARQGPVHLHRPADEMARQHRLADPRRGGVRDAGRGMSLRRRQFLGRAAASLAAPAFPRFAWAEVIRRGRCASLPALPPAAASTSRRA